MADLVSRPGAVLPAGTAAAILFSLSRHQANPFGEWRIQTVKWELWSGSQPDPNATLLAAIDIAHGVPHPHAVTMTKVHTTAAGLAAGLTGEAVCDLALAHADLSLANCERTTIDAPPAPFHGERVTDRNAWKQASAQSFSSESLPLPEPIALPSHVEAGALADAAAALAAAIDEAHDEVTELPAFGVLHPASLDASLDAALDAAEDRELRRLHYLASFGGLTSGPMQRYRELRARDRRNSIRPPVEDDLLLVPRQRLSSDWIEFATGS